jgi:hypothetical protein
MCAGQLSCELGERNEEDPFKSDLLERPRAKESAALVLTWLRYRLVDERARSTEPGQKQIETVDAILGHLAEA